MRLGRLGWLDVIGPPLAVAVLFALVVGGRLHTTYHGNITGFVLFGRHFARLVGTPHGAVVLSKFGYDGQFFYLQAKDPLLLHGATLADFRRAGGESFRMQRMAYPALAWVLAAGRRSALPWSLLAINVLVALGVTTLFAVYARRRGWSGWWGLAIGLMAGLLTGTLRDLSDPLAVASMLGGLLLWRRRRRWGAAALLVAAVLAREAMALAVLAIAIDTVARWWRARHQPGTRARIAREAWPVVLIPAAALVIWQAYATARYGGSIATPGSAYRPPFVGLLDEVRHAAENPSARNLTWELAYLGLLALAVAASLALARRRLTAPAVASALFGLSLLVLVFGDPWSYTRLSMPMFAALLLAGLEQRDRLALTVCAAAAALTVAMPFAPWLAAS